MDEQLPLFDFPHPPPRMAVRPGAPRYVRFKPAFRWLCDDCVTAIRTLGVEEAPLPRPVRWKRLADGPSMALCDAHKSERLKAGG